MPGTLVVGDGVGGSGPTKSTSPAWPASNEIAATAAVTVNNSGLLDLNSNSNTIGSLIMSGGTVTTETGTLTLGGNVAGLASSTNLTPATINGNLALGTAVRTFDIQQGDVVTNGVLNPTWLSTRSSAARGGGINKISDPGTLLLDRRQYLHRRDHGEFRPSVCRWFTSGSSAVTTTGNGVLGGTAFPSGSAGATVGSLAAAP